MECSPHHESPPAKKAKIELSIPILSPVIPPSLPTPSPSPSPGPTFTIPDINGIVSNPIPSSSSSHPLPPSPTSELLPLSLTEDLEVILMMRGLHREMLTPAVDIELFSKTQVCLASCYLDQLTMKVTPKRLDLLLDYLEFGVSPLRAPPADLLTRLWTLTTDVKVLKVVGFERIQRAGSLFRSLLSLRPPWISPLIQKQYSCFLISLNKNNGPFSLWMHIQQLLSPQLYKNFYLHIDFIIDLLLSDYWASVHGWGCSSPPLFLSVFWRNPSSNPGSVSLPVRQLLDTITNTILSSTNSENQFQAVQSQMILLYMVMTHCGINLIPDLLNLAVRLSTDQFYLFTCCLHPTRLVSSLIQYCDCQGGGGRRNDSDLISSAGKVSDIIHQLSVTSLSSQPVKQTTEYSDTSIPTTIVNDTSAMSNTSTGMKPKIMLSPSANKAQEAGSNQNGVKPTKFYRSSVSTVIATPLAPFTTPNSNHRPFSPQSSERKKLSLARRSPTTADHPAKKLRLSSCENCDEGVINCHRCTTSPMK